MVKVMAVAEALDQLSANVMATMHDVGSRPQQDDGRSDALGSLEYSGDGERLARRRTQGIAIARRSYQISAAGPMYRGPGAGANGPLRPGHEAGRETVGRRVRDARQRDEGDSGSHPGESGLRGPVPATAIINPKSIGAILCDYRRCARENSGTAFSWALYGSGNRWHRNTGDFVSTIRELLEAGAVLLPDPEVLNQVMRCSSFMVPAAFAAGTRRRVRSATSPKTLESY